MAKINRNNQFFYQQEFEKALFMVKEAYVKDVDAVDLLSQIAHYAKQSGKSKEEQKAIGNYLVLYLRHIAEVENDEDFVFELNALLGDAYSLSQLEEYEMIKEFLDID